MKNFIKKEENDLFSLRNRFTHFLFNQFSKILSNQLFLIKKK
jgi:hypothetical protein